MMIANNTQIYWQNTAHSNHPVLVAALGVGADRFKGYYDNAEFGQKLKALADGKNRINSRQSLMTNPPPKRQAANLRDR